MLPNLSPSSSHLSPCFLSLYSIPFLLSLHYSLLSLPFFPLIPFPFLPLHSFLLLFLSPSFSLPLHSSIWDIEHANKLVTQHNDPCSFGKMTAVEFINSHDITFLLTGSGWKLLYETFTEF